MSCECESSGDPHEMVLDEEDIEILDNSVVLIKATCDTCSWSGRISASLCDFEFFETF
jgi:hypothetical protein